MAKASRHGQKAGSTATAETTRDSTSVDDSTTSSDKPSKSVETERSDGENEEADQQAKNATDKGLKASAWNSLVAQRNASDGRKLERGQYKSKVNRLMHTYELIKSKPKDKSLLKKIREFGFPHATVCSLIARTGNNVAPSSIEVGASSTAAPTTSTAAKTTAPATRNPSSHQQRVEKVKRIRGGASKSHRSKKKAKTSEDSNMDDMMRTLKLYIKMKMMDLKVRRSSADSDTHHPDQQYGDGGLESHRTGDEQEETKEGYDSAFFFDDDEGKQVDV
ncbi:hypothetical protein PHMEG_00019853 [Phytophthora megakarya]|uniref:Uncharacterized protein n=1 Tax=Phytophthora megakarya TaxID=4795 RepID=A0A225VRT9_9STRA|nr:hypothetical protein PHMEG_00019853 [Phytophthora megakarya]